MTEKKKNAEEKESSTGALDEEQLENVSAGVGALATNPTSPTAGESINIGVGELQECTISKSPMGRT